MGNNHPNPNPLPEFQPLPLPHPTNLTLLQHRRTSQLLIYKQLHPTSSEERDSIREGLHARENGKSSFVNEVVYWREVQGKGYCGGGAYFGVLWNNVVGMLRGYVGKLVAQGRAISVEELSSILDAFLKGLRYYQSLNHVHNKIDLDCLMFDGRRTILVDPWLTDQSAKSQAQNIYKSPQKQLYEKDEILSYDKFKSLLYEFGLLLLDLVTGGKYGNNYRNLQINQGLQKKIIKVNIGGLLDEVSDFKFRSKLSVLLNLNPQKRLVIYNILLPDKVILKQFNPHLKPIQHPLRTDHTNKSQPKSLKKSKNSKDNIQTCSPSPTNTRHPSHKYFSYQVSPQSRSIEKNPTNGQQKSMESSFTYAQMLRTPTETSQNFDSKRVSPFTHIRSHPQTMNWPNAHKLLHLDKETNRSGRREVEVSPFQLKLNGDRYHHISRQSTEKLATISSVSHLHQNSFTHSNGSAKLPINQVPLTNIHPVTFLYNQQPQLFKPSSQKFQAPKATIPTNRAFSPVPTLNSININNRPLQQYQKAQNQEDSPTKNQNKLGYGFSFGNQSSIKASPPTPSFLRLESLKSFGNKHSMAQDGDVGTKKNTIQSVQQSEQHQEYQLPPPQQSFIKIQQDIQQSKQKQKQKQSPQQQTEQTQPSRLQSQFNYNDMSDRIIIDRKEIQAKETESIIFDQDLKRNVEEDMRKYSAFGAQRAVRMQSNPVQGKFKNFAQFISPTDPPLKEPPIIVKHVSEFHPSRHPIIKSFRNGPAINNKSKEGIESGSSSISNGVVLRNAGKLVNSVEEKTNSQSESVVDLKYKPVLKGSRGISKLVVHHETLQQPEQKIEQEQPQPEPQQPSQSPNNPSPYPSIHTIINNLKSTTDPDPYLDSNLDLRIYTIQHYGSDNGIQQRYEGYKLHDVKNGHGVYYYANGYVYEGLWRDDKEHGPGRLLKQRYVDDGKGRGISKNVIQNREDYETICEGMWQNGHFVGGRSSRSSQNSSSRSGLSKKQPSIANFLPPPSNKTISSNYNSSGRVNG